MSVPTLLPRSNLRLGRQGRQGLSRWHWGPEGQTQRVVKVAVLDTENEGSETGRIARVFALEGRTMTLVEEKPDVVAQGWEPRGHTGYVAFADGTRWELSQGGCGCGSPLKKFDPARWSPS